MLGVVQTRELLAQMLSGRPLNVRTSFRNAPAIQDTADALDALAVLRSAEVPMALVHDEYGHFEGVATPADLLEAIAGVFRADADTAQPAAVRRDDGSWPLAGWLPADRDYHTVAGYVLAVLRRLPKVGEQVSVGDWRSRLFKLRAIGWIS